MWCDTRNRHVSNRHRHFVDVFGTQSAFSSVDMKHSPAQICVITHLFLFICKSKMSNSNDSLSDSEFDYGDDEYMFEPTRSNDDTVGPCW